MEGGDRDRVFSRGVVFAPPSWYRTAATPALIVFFVAQDVINIVVYFSTHKSGVSGWRPPDGIIAPVLGLMIWRHWPSRSLWVVGMLVGMNMIITGNGAADAGHGTPSSREGASVGQLRVHISAYNG